MATPDGKVVAVEREGEGENRQRSQEECIRGKKPGNVISQAKNAVPAKVDNPKLGELQNETILIFQIDELLPI
jgi:hypothetical protein